LARWSTGHRTCWRLPLMERIPLPLAHSLTGGGECLVVSLAI
jgi:hypothetical protein